jgi:soluble lytic murein transglycosylase-like protein
MFVMLIVSQTLTYTEDGTPMISNTQLVEVNEEAVVETVDNSYNNIIQYYCADYGVDPELVKIVIEKESQFNPNAVSKSGAIGLMQLMPETAEMLGVDDPYNPWENIKGGVKFLRDLLDMFNGDLELSLAAYHAGPTIVKKNNRVPAIPETMEYVEYIMSRYGGETHTNDRIFLTTSEDGTPLFTNRSK